MSKKTFKDKTDHLDKFFSETDDGTHRTHEPHKTHNTRRESAPKYYRINLKLKAEFKDFLNNASWEKKQSITQYINDLIQADMDTRNTKDT